MPTDLPSPWGEFLGELDAQLDEPIELHCIGGFAVIVGSGLPRSTNDLDYRTLIPYKRINDLQEIAGEGSALAQKYNVHLQYTAVDSMPESYDDRLTEVFPGRFKNLRLFIPDPYDLVLSKLGRNNARDREDVEFIAKTKHLHPSVLRERYAKELRPILIGPPDRHDATLEFWMEDYFARPQS
jgi:hypothetical protein